MGCVNAVAAEEDQGLFTEAPNPGQKSWGQGFELPKLTKVQYVPKQDPGRIHVTLLSTHPYVPK